MATPETGLTRPGLCVKEGRGRTALLQHSEGWRKVPDIIWSNLPSD